MTGFFFAMLVTEQQDPKIYKALLEQNLKRQYDLLSNFIEIGIMQGPEAFDKYMLWSLNHIAVAGTSQFGGRFREGPVYIGNHKPPHFKQVPDLMDRFISFIHENWLIMPPTQLAGYGLWRLNWIHPFIDGNGRTARAICYYLLCARIGAQLPGKKTVPERIRNAKDEYINCLRESDEHWENGHLELVSIEAYLAALVKAQVEDKD